MIPYAGVVTQGDNLGKWQVKFLDLAMQRGQLHPREFDSEEEAKSSLERMGWRLMNGTTGTYRPRPQNTSTLEKPVAVPRGSDVDISGDGVAMVYEKDLQISVHLSGVEHAQLGECYGFFYIAYQLTEGDARILVPATYLSPVFDFISMGLFKVECIGYYLTESSALRAADELFQRLVSMTGRDNYIKLIRERIQGVNAYVDWARRSAGLADAD